MLLVLFCFFHCLYVLCSVSVLRCPVYKVSKKNTEQTKLTFSSYCVQLSLLRRGVLIDKKIESVKSTLDKQLDEKDDSGDSGTDNVVRIAPLLGLSVDNAASGMGLVCFVYFIIVILSPLSAVFF